MYPRCGTELQARLRPARLAYRAIEDAKQGLAANGATSGNNATAAAAGADASEDTDADGDAEMAGAASRDCTGEMTGRYDLIAVLTHKGRTLDSGHYIGWVKHGDDSWIQYDDDKLIPRKDEDITALSGGGDWHTAYLLLYKAQRVPEGEVKAEKGEVSGLAATEVEKPGMDVPAQKS